METLINFKDISGNTHNINIRYITDMVIYKENNECRIYDIRGYDHVSLETYYKVIDAFKENNKIISTKGEEGLEP